jgi:hypothetical protein
MILKKLLYKKECRGTVEKDGKRFKKYKKVKRALFNQKWILYLFLVVVLLAAIGAVLLHGSLHLDLKKFTPDDFSPAVSYSE